MATTLPGMTINRLGFWLLLLSALLTLTIVDAKKEPTTESPSAAPSTIPTLAPTALPTTNPTNGPTHTPTTSKPTQTKTQAPTSSPTALPTVMSTLEPTESPTNSSMAFATSSPTSYPSAMITTRVATNSPTDSPTEPEVSVTGVALPSLGINAIVTDEDGALATADVLQSALIEFVEDILEMNTGVDSFDYASFDFDIIQSSFGRRKLEVGLSIKIDGVAYFGDDAPTADDLAASFRVYFSVWGLEELERHLQENGLLSTQVATVSIDGDVVKAASGNLDANTGATVQQPDGNETDEIPFGIIAGLAIGCLVLVLAIGLIAVLTHRSRRNGRKRPIRHSLDDDTDTVVAAAAQKSSNTQSIHDEEQSVCGLSVDMSLYTTEESLAPQSVTMKTYDPKRLDKLIEVARKHSDLSEGMEKA